MCNLPTSDVANQLMVVVCLFDICFSLFFIKLDQLQCLERTNG